MRQDCIFRKVGAKSLQTAEDQEGEEPREHATRLRTLGQAPGSLKLYSSALLEDAALGHQIVKSRKELRCSQMWVSRALSEKPRMFPLTPPLPFLA